MKALEPKQGNMCRGGHKIHLFDCCLIDLFYRCFNNYVFLKRQTQKLVETKQLTRINLLHPCFIDCKNLFDCCLIEISKDKKFIS